MYWVHILNVLTAGWRLHASGTRALYDYYVTHHALGLLRSGVTSETGGRRLLWWLAAHRVAPVDW